MGVTETAAGKRLRRRPDWQASSRYPRCSGSEARDADRVDERAGSGAACATGLGALDEAGAAPGENRRRVATRGVLEGLVHEVAEGFAIDLELALHGGIS